MGIKRFRITKVCDFCKKRRVKCDLEQPCSTCIKYKKECTYTERNSMVKQGGEKLETPNVKHELNELKNKLKLLEKSVTSEAIPPESNYDINEFVNVNDFIGNNQIESNLDNYNFFERLTPTKDKDPIRKRNSGPLSWITLIKNDNANSLVWNHMSTIKDSFDYKVFANQNNASQTDIDFTKKVHDENKVQSASFGLSFYQGGLNEELQLVEKIKFVLPTKQVIWLLYDRFFNILYPLFPIIDETNLKVNLEKILGDDLHVEKKTDFIYLGILLIILRLSFISLFSHDLSTNESNYRTELKVLYDNPVNIEVINIACSCFHLFNYMRNSNITLLQLGVLIRLYHSIAPEEGDGLDGGDAEVSIAMLIRMALQLDLHREPDKFDHSSRDEKLNNLGRKIWYTLIMQDLDNAMAHGTGLNVNAYSFDTEIPFYTPGNENVTNATLEKIAGSGFPNLESAYEPLYELQDMLFKVKGTVNLSVFVKKLNYVERYLEDRYGSILEDYNFNLNLEESFLMSINLKIFFNCTYWLLSIYSHLMNHYERIANQRLLYYYLKKSFSMCLNKVIPFVDKIMGNLDKLKPPHDLLITPSLELACHKSIILSLAIYVRLQYSINVLQYKYDHLTRMKSNNPADTAYKVHFKKLNNCFNLLSKSSDFFLKCLSKLSYRYYYAWRVTKAQKYVTSIVDDEFMRKYKLPYNVDLLTTEMLTDLENIMINSLNQIEQAKKPSMTYTPSPTNLLTSDTINQQADSIWVQMLGAKNNDFSENLNFEIPQQLVPDIIHHGGENMAVNPIDNYLFDEFLREFL
ncbi:unnamed protein product [Candida verbasci]|uniref:Zn(2)-C6 fungal-type domain-containing protein n=1 Tax=Candida verbasci TaxID=1227364 RepID=A0A9W4XKU1_9ASCO|nr:unnamed protein product [Candida verbasci]